MSRLLQLVLALSLVSLTAAGCTTEPYGACTLPSSKALNDACSPQGGGGDNETQTAASCVIDFVFECDTQLCGTYKGSDAFCTERCDGKCLPGCTDGGTCLEWVPGTSEFFCVPVDLTPPGICG